MDRVSKRVKNVERHDEDKQLSVTVNQELRIQKNTIIKHNISSKAHHPKYVHIR